MKSLSLSLSSYLPLVVVHQGFYLGTKNVLGDFIATLPLATDILS